MQVVTDSMVNLVKRVPETVSIRKELLIAMRHSFRPEIRSCVITLHSLSIDLYTAPDAYAHLQSVPISWTTFFTAMVLELCLRRDTYTWTD